MGTNDPIRALEEVNKQYIELLFSNEYRIGKRITKLKSALKSVNIKELVIFFKSLMMQISMKKISSDVSFQESFYNRCEKNTEAKSVVYSCITNGYDYPNEPIFKTSDLILYTDNNEYISNSWIRREIEIEIQKLKGNKINRYYKMHPFALFKEYDFSIYVDGNIQIVSDVTALLEIAQESRCGIAMHLHPGRNCTYVEAEVCKKVKRGNALKISEQVEKYRNDYFPENFGFFEATIIVVDLHNKIAKEILDAWYDEFCRSESERDQLALPYIIWKCGYNMNDIGVLGNNLLYNPMFRVTNLGEHKFK